jgi:hypothetical protein
MLKEIFIFIKHYKTFMKSNGGNKIINYILITVNVIQCEFTDICKHLTLSTAHTIFVNTRESYIMPGTHTPCADNALAGIRIYRILLKTRV